MCGLVGIAGDLEFRDEATMKRMLVYDFFRGPDSTGFAVLRRNGDHHVVKLASHPIDLFDMKRFTDALSGYNSFAFLGHNRLATKGKVNGNNAHPYQYGHIIGAHNGTLDAASWKRLNAAIGYDTDVDSQAIFAAFEKIGVEETIKLMEQGRTSQDGAWALTWLDLKQNTLHFLRNKHRPLWYAYSEDFKKVFWASEWQTIDMATKLSDRTPYKIYADKEGYRFWEMQEDWLYTFDLEELKAGYKSRPKPRVKIVKGKEPTPVAHTAVGTPPFRADQSSYDGPRKITPTTTMLGTKNSTTSNGSSRGGTTERSDNKVTVLPLPIPVTQSKPLGDYMTREQFEGVYARHGCSWCHNDIPFGSPGISIYEMTGHILCSDCTDNKDTTRIYTHRAEIEAFKKNLDDNTTDKKKVA